MGADLAGDVYLNEVAPRVHNSGHYTMDACECSQFEQHLRVVTGLPLGSTSMKVRRRRRREGRKRPAIHTECVMLTRALCVAQVNAAVMLNILGNGNNNETYAPCARALTVPGVVCRQLRAFWAMIFN